MKRVVLILIVLTLTLILGSAVAVTVQTRMFEIDLPEAWTCREAANTYISCERIQDGKTVAAFSMFDLDSSQYIDSTEKMADQLRADFGIDGPAEEFQVAEQKSALITRKLDGRTVYYTGYNVLTSHAALMYMVLDGYEVEGELETATASLRMRSWDDYGYFRFGDAEVMLKAARTKKVGSRSYLMLDFTWRNAGQDITFFAVQVDVTVFQDGVQLQEGFLLDEKSEIGTQLMPGKSIDVTKVYELRSDKGEIEFFVDKLMDFQNQYVDRKYSFKLKQP